MTFKDVQNVKGNKDVKEILKFKDIKGAIDILKAFSMSSFNIYTFCTHYLCSHICFFCSHYKQLNGDLKGITFVVL